ALLDGGAEGLLATLPPMIRWRAPVLEADYPVDRDLYLDGRGLLLQPSFFCRGTPVVYRDPSLPPVLVYPVTHTGAPAFAEPGPWLGRLVGHTRSAVLQSIGPPSCCARASGTAASRWCPGAAVPGTGSSATATSPTNCP
ncbi:hypothetical protein ABZ943_43075, partial [Streptomyces rubiginosohelvolus]